MTSNRFPVSDYERLCSFAPEIAEALSPNAPRRDTKSDVRFGNKGALVVSKNHGGGWFDHSAGIGGVSVITFIQHRLSCDRIAALDYAKNWLDTHLGTGSSGAMGLEDDENDVSIRAHAEYARQVIASAVPVIGTPAEKYLKSRRLEPPYPECVRYFADARIGEGAVVGILSSLNGPVGVQLGYTDPDGRKTTIEPKRRVYLSDRKQPAAFRIDVSNPDARAPAIVITEGLEDALSIAQARAAIRVLGVPGVARIRALSQEWLA